MARLFIALALVLSLGLFTVGCKQDSGEPEVPDMTEMSETDIPDVPEEAGAGEMPAAGTGAAGQAAEAIGE